MASRIADSSPIPLRIPTPPVSPGGLGTALKAFRSDQSFEAIQQPAEVSMAFTIEVTRPDDLLRLHIRAHNLKRARSSTGGAELVVDDAAEPAYLVVAFPPQAIGEGAHFEASIVAADVPPGQTEPPPPQTIGTPDPPGSVTARIARSSRLVFTVPPGARIPLTIEGLLDWSGLELRVHPIAAIGPKPTPAEIAQAPAIRRPTDVETSIELPYRLVISPTAEVRWAHRLRPFTAHGRTELWHTRLQLPAQDGAAELTPAAPAPLRAIWSDDYSSVAMPDPTAEDPHLGLSAMSPSDRHQIVVLTSAFHGYEGEVTINLGGGLLGGMGGVLGGGARLGDLTSGPAFGLAPTLAFGGVPITVTRPYVPQPFYADQLMLSSLGGYLRSRGHWTPPAKVKRRFQFEPVPFDGLFQRLLLDVRGNPSPGDAPPRPPLGPAGTTPAPASVLSPFALSVLARHETEQLDLSEWVHIATQGRDHYVRIVYEGELLPFRNRAALVKVTERKFKEENGLVVARLFQRMFIVVREPEKRFTATDRGMLLKHVRLTTLVTPDIAQPAYVEAGTRSFWVEVMTSPDPNDRARFKFHAVGTDSAGRTVDFTIPMMFVSISDTGTKRTTAIRAYNASGSKSVLDARSAVVPGQTLHFADPDQAASTDNTRLVTRALNFVMVNGGDAPRLLKADVDIPQVQELLGTDAPATIRLHPGFVSQGLDAATGVFAEIVTEDFSKFLPDDPFAGLQADTLGVTFKSDQAGGFATPNLGVSTLSRRLGPLAGKASDALTDTFDPTTFFQQGLAQLFGTFDLFDLIPAGTLGKNAPKLTTSSAPIAGGTLLTAKIDWEPEVKNLSLPPGVEIASFEKDHGGTTTLVIHGTVQTPMKAGPSGPPVAAEPTSVFTGALTHFRVGVLKAVYLNFDEFGFESRSGSKTDVRVKLDPATPIQFAGDLQFVEELRKIIPPDLFGDGPSLDLSPTGVRAGFSFGLPPVAVGVFALKDVSLGAALTLPFFDGKPTFDFNVSERPHPFLLSVGIFGGGGFFRLQLDTAGLRLVEAAFEFGATASIDLGVASGGVFIMAGIYFKLERQEPSDELAPMLTGYLRMGGHLSVLGLIKVSLEFNLSFTYDGATDKAYGRATLTVKVEVVFFSASVEVTVEKAFGGQSGDPSFGQLFAAPEAWSEYATAFA